MENTAELMKVEQLPIIKQNLYAIKADIESRTSEAMKLVCTEDTVKEIKKIRTQFNSELASYETARKKIKTAVMNPYTEFENVYKECITNSFKSADSELKNKIDLVENTIKNKRKEEVESYFNELKTASGIEFINFGQVRLNITLSASLKSLKEECKKFVDGVTSDLELIETQDYKDEVLVEYKESLNVSQSIIAVKNRHIALERMAEEKAKREAIAEEQAKTVEKVEEAVEISAPIVLSAPKEVEKTYTSTFKVTGTMSELKAIKEFLNNGGYKYEC